ncbi:MAG: lysis protein [Proteobacteria bacterium]|nr:lysis protein [Pseudomonadota bacterium]
MIGLSELRAGAWKYACIAVTVLAVAAAFSAAVFQGRAAVSARRADAAISRAKGAEAALHDAQHVIETERESVRVANQVAAQYEQDKINAQARADSLAADLRAGRVRLREPWRTCPTAVPEAAADPGKPAGEADARTEGAVDLVRDADNADAQIRALQELLKAERQ